MEMRIAARLVVLIATLLFITMVIETLTCMPHKLTLKLHGDEVGNNNIINIKMKNGWFESLPRGPVPPSSPSQCKNYRSSGRGSCPVKQMG